MIVFITVLAGSIGVRSVSAQEVPAAPSQVSALLRLPASIELQWTDNSDNEINFTISRFRDGSPLAERTFVAYSNQVFFADATSLEHGVEYCYEVRALGTFGLSPASNRACVTAVVILPVETPESFSVRANPPSKIVIEWQDVASNNLRTVVQRSGDQGQTWQDFVLGPTDSRWEDTNITHAQNYCYRAYTQNEYFTSEFTPTACAAAIVVTPPAPASGLSVTVRPPDAVEVRWTDPADNEVNWVVQRSVDGGNSWNDTLVNADAVYYEDTNLENGVSYCYRVRSRNDYFVSQPTTSQCVTAVIVLPPAAPSNLATTAKPPDAVLISWRDNATNDEHIILERSADGGVTWTASILAANQTQFRDVSIGDGVSYCYRAFSRNKYYESQRSNLSCVTAIVVVPPTAPSKPVVSVVNAITLDVSWQDLSDNESHFSLERSTDGGVVWEIVAATPRGVVFTDTDIFPGANYCYRVSAKNEYFSSPVSESTCARSSGILPLSPEITNVDVTSAVNTSLSWQLDNPFALNSMYRLERRSDSGAWDLVGDQLEDKSYSETDLAELTDYCYRVQMHSGDISTPWSNVACAKTALIAPAVPGLLSFEVEPASPHNSIKAMWSSSSPQRFLSYDVELVTEQGSTVSMRTSNVEHLFDSLPDWTEFQIRVRAHRTAGNLEAASEWSAPMTARTLLAFRPGDTNGDGRVNVNDVLHFTRDDIYNERTTFDGSADDINWQVVPLNPGNVRPEVYRSDTNRDGTVDIFDFFAIVRNYGEVDPDVVTITKVDAISGKQAEILDLLLRQKLMQSDNAQVTSLKADLEKVLDEFAASLPDVVTLKPNYPNPFSGSTTFAFDLPESRDVELRVFNLLGQEVSVVTRETLPPGRHAFTFDSNGLPSGLYVYRLVAGNEVRTGRMVVQR